MINEIFGILEYNVLIRIDVHIEGRVQIPSATSSQCAFTDMALANPPENRGAEDYSMVQRISSVFCLCAMMLATF